GGTRSIPVDVRIVTGAKRPLGDLVAEGKFREDLYYRLNVVPIQLPPLRERREDIPVLTDHFLDRFFERGGIRPEVSTTVREAFLRYTWPGNVRELENACERIAQTCTCSQVRCACMPASILFHTPRGPLPARAAEPSPLPRTVSLDGRLEQVESQLIAWALRVSHGNKSRAAELLTVRRSTLGDRIRKLGIAAPDGVDRPIP